jgi:threonine-phosphate decarboxylase
MHKVPRPYTDPGPLFRHGGAPSVPQEALLDLSVNVNPLGPPASVLRALRQALRMIANYPDPECQQLAARLATYHRVDPRQIVVGNGSNELIYTIARTFTPRRVAIAEPTYTEYLRASLSVGASAEHWLAEGCNFLVTCFDPKGADLVWLANPNNPTGQRWPPAWVMAEWMQEQPGSVFIVDEAFLPFWSDAAERTLVPHVERLRNLIVLRSMTKFFTLPGLRLGYAVTTPELAQRLGANLVPWSVNVLAQSAGVAAVDDVAFHEKTLHWFERNASRFQYDLAGLPGFDDELQLIGSYANFVLLKLKHKTSRQLVMLLRERGIAIRDASNFVGLGDHYVRLAVSTPGNNRRLLDALASVL